MFDLFPDVQCNKYLQFRSRSATHPTPCETSLALTPPGELIHQLSFSKMAAAYLSLAESFCRQF